MPRSIQLKESAAPYNVTIDAASAEAEPVILKQGDEPVLAVISYREYREFAEWRERRRAHSAEAAALDREQRAYEQLRPGLLRTYRGQFVALREGQLVDSDADETTLVKRVYKRFGCVPLYITRVQEIERVYHIPGPRVSR